MKDQAESHPIESEPFAKGLFAAVAEKAPSGRRAVLHLFAVVMALGGCAIQGAPSFVIVGAYFPAWMFCALIGIFGAMAARGLFVATGLDSVLPFQLFVCSSVGLIIAALAWLIWFGQ